MLNKTWKIISLVLFLILFTLFVLNQHQLIIYPYQHELREGAIASTMAILKEGKNPYGFQYHPQNMYVYGLGQPLGALPFSFFIDSNLVSARLFTSLCIIFTCVLIFLVLKKHKVSYITSFITISIILYQFTLFSNHAYPNAFAILILFISIFVPWQYAFSTFSVSTGIFIAIIGMNVKPYVLLGFPIIILYTFLFVSRLKALKGMVFGCIALILSILILNYFFPAYFVDTYYSFKGSNLSSFGHLKIQLISFIKDNSYYLIGLIPLTFNSSNKQKIYKAFQYFNKNENQNLSFLIEKLISIKPDYFLFAALVGLGAFVVKLGHHMGSCCATYLYHIFTPFLLVYLACQTTRISSKSFFNFTLMALAIYQTYLFREKYAEINFILKHQLKETEIIMRKLDAYKAILNSPEYVSYLTEKGKPVWNNGQTEYFKDALNVDFDMKKQALICQERYINKIEKGIKNQSFDLVTQTHNYFGYNPVNREHLEKYYTLSEVVYYPMLLGGWEMELWIKKLNP